MATDDQTLQPRLQTLTRTLLDEAFVASIGEGIGQLSGPEVARAAVMDIASDRFGAYAYQDVSLAPST